MKTNRTMAVTYVFAVVFVVLPVVVAFGVLIASGGRWEPEAPFPFLWTLALTAVLPGVLFLGRARQLQRQRASLPPSTRAAYEVLKLGALGLGCFVAAEFFLVASIDWRVGAGYLGLVVVWVLIWIPRRNRKLLMRAAIDVSCTPQAAFDLVSNPNNWPLYVPEIELVQPVAVPMQLGSVIHGRVRREGKITLEADEEVVAFEPGARFGTAMRQDTQPSSGIYEFEPVSGGTRIQYTYRTLISLPAAIFGIGLLRSRLVKAMSDRRTQSFARIKGLLEEPAATSV